MGRVVNAASSPCWRRESGTALVAGRIVLPLCTLLAVVAGCQGTRGTDDVSPIPTLPPPEIPPPSKWPIPDEKTVHLGFAQERIELVEGEGAVVEIVFEPAFPLRSPGGLPDALTFDLWLEVEPGSGSAADLAVSGGVRVGDYLYVLPAGTTWLALRGVVDDEAEMSESLNLRLVPAEPGGEVGLLVEGQYPEVFAFTNEVLEVLLRDGGGDRCRGVGIRAGHPRRAQLVTKGDQCFKGAVYETEVTIEADRAESVQLDRLTSHGRISDWRVGFAGSRVQHQLVVQWRPLDWGRWEMRVQPCASEGRGPTLVCTLDSCKVYPEGSRIPAPQKPRCEP